MIKNSNLWQDTYPSIKNTSSSIVKNVDVLIIGGGIAGVCLLYNLYQADITNVVLVEENSLGSHSGGRNLGILSLRGSVLFSQMSPEIGKNYLNFIGENNRKFFNGLRAVSFDTDLKDSGSYRFAKNNLEMEMLEKEATFIRKNRDIDCPALSKKEIELLTTVKDYVGGIYMPNEASINPIKVINGLASLADPKQNKILIDSHVESIEKNDDETFNATIRHRGVIRAKHIVYCTGAYTDSLLSSFKNIVLPYRNQYIATDYTDKEIMRIFPHMNLSFNNNQEIVRSYSGRILASGMRQAVRGQQEKIIFDGEVSITVFDKLKEFLFGTFPYLGKLKITHVWSSVQCKTTDELPLVGKISGSNLFVMTAFNGYGFNHMLGASTIIRDMIKFGSSSDPMVSIFNPERFYECKT